MHEFRIIEFVDSSGKSPFHDWISLLDVTTRARIHARLFRIESGNLGDVKPLASGLYEARLNFGPGYRIYFGIADHLLIVLLAGGDKKNQDRDIRSAKINWILWKRGQSRAKKKS